MRFLIISSFYKNSGLGHFKRSKIFFDYLTKLNHEVKLINHSDSNFHSTKNKNIIYLKDETKLLFHLNTLKPNVIVFDGLKFNFSFLDILFKNYFTVSISPVSKINNRVNLIFSRYYQIDKKNIFYGLKYSIFEINFKKIKLFYFIKNLIFNDTLNISISMGGEDSQNKTLQILQILKKLKRKVCVWIFIGEGYSHSYELLANTLMNNEKNKFLLIKSNSIWEFCQNCQLGVFTGGLTTLESIYYGLPSINIFSRNKLNIKDETKQIKKICLGINYFDELELEKKLLDKIENLKKTDLIKNKYRLRNYLDTKGSNRILKKIIKSYNKSDFRN